MILPVANVPNVISTFIDEELMPKGTSAQKLMTVFVGVGMCRYAQKVIESNKDILKSIGILNDEGIELEELRDIALEAFTKSGPVEVMGIIFEKEDVPIAYEIARKFAKEK